MKSYIFSLLIVVPFIINGQISITQSDMPSAGDTIRTSSTFDVGFIDFEETGSDFTWDFTSMSPFSQSVDTFVSVSETPFFYQILFFLTANLAQQEFEFDQFPGFQITDSYRYYKNSSSSFKEVGFGVSLNGIPLPNLYDDADVIYDFPVEIGNVDSSMANYDFQVPGLGYYGGWKKRKNNVDGWGTVITPYGSFEVIRLKTEIIQYDSLYIDSLGFGLPIYQELTEYKWLGKEKGLPLVHVSDNGIIQTISYIDSVRNIFTNNIPIVEEHKLEIYPNPAYDQVHLSLDLPAGELIRIELINVKGERVLEQKAQLQGTELILPLDRSRFSDGTYFLNVRWDQGGSSGKLILK